MRLPETCPRKFWASIPGLLYAEYQWGSFPWICRQTRYKAAVCTASCQDIISNCAVPHPTNHWGWRAQSFKITLHGLVETFPDGRTLRLRDNGICELVSCISYIDSNIMYGTSENFIFEHTVCPDMTVRGHGLREDHCLICRVISNDGEHVNDRVRLRRRCWWRWWWWWWRLGHTGISQERCSRILDHAVGRLDNFAVRLLVAIVLGRDILHPTYLATTVNQN